MGISEESFVVCGIACNCFQTLMFVLQSLKALPNLPMAERFICPDPPVGTPMSLGFQRSLTKSSGFRREVTMDSVEEEEGSEARPTPTLEKERMVMNTVRIPTESSASPVSQTGSPGQYETSMLEGYTSSVMEVIKIFLFI